MQQHNATFHVRLTESFSLQQLRQKLRARSKLYTAITLMLALVFTAVTPFSPISSLWRRAKSNSIVPPVAAAPIHLPQTTPNTLYNPYWYLDQRTTATLEIANHTAADRSLTPILFLRGSQKLSLEPVKVPSLGTVRIRLNQVLRQYLDDLREPVTGGWNGEGAAPPWSARSNWGDGSRRNSLWGSASLQAESTDHIFSRIIIENARESLSIGTEFGNDKHPSLILASMWYLPTARSKVLYAIQNPSESAASVATFLYMDGQLLRGRNIELAGSSSRLLDLRELLPDSESARPLPEAGGVRFVALNTERPIEGRTVIYDERTGFSMPLAMHTVSDYPSNDRQLPGALFGRPDKSLGFPDQTRFDTRLLLTNTSGNMLEVIANLSGRNAEGKQISWKAPAIELKPYESRLAELGRNRSQSGIVDGYVGVQLTHNGRMVDLMAEAVTLDQTGSFSFYAPFRDSKLIRRSQHIVSFDLTGNKNTLLVVRNVSDQPAQYTYQINYEEGGNMLRYLSPSQVIAPRASRMIDLKELRDTGVEDAEGKRLPQAVSFGNLTIFGQQRALIVSEPIFDPVSRISDENSLPMSADFCEGDGDPICPDECSQCCDHESNVCYRNFAACEGAATAGLLAGLNLCENASFCQEGNPNFNQGECDRCKDYVWAAYAIASGACVTVLGFCLSDVGNTCVFKKKPDPNNPKSCSPDNCSCGFF